MKRIVIIGCPGSGKSFLSKKLHAVLDIPLYHLDSLWWKEDRTHITRDEFDQALERILRTDSWILDGDYSRTYETRMQAADTVIFLDFPKDLCLEGIRQRERTERDDCPISQVDEDLLSEVEWYQTENRPQVLSLLEKYADKKVLVFNTRDSLKEWVSSLHRTTMGHGELMEYLRRMEPIYIIEDEPKYAPRPASVDAGSRETGSLKASDEYAGPELFSPEDLTQ